MGSISGQPFLGLSIDVWLGSSQGFGWATQGHSQSSLSHSWIVFAVYSLSGWMVNLQPNLDKVFIKDISVLCPFSFPSTFTSPPVPAPTPQHDATTTKLHCWNGIGQVMSDAWFPPDMALRIEAKQFNLGFIRPENLVSHRQSHFRWKTRESPNAKRPFMCRSHLVTLS